MKRLLPLAALVLAALAGPAASQTETQAGPPPPDDGRPVVIGRSYALPSKLLGDVRRINVYLPEHYGEPGRTFPVLYLLDGGETEDFHHITGLAQITAAYGAGRELIVVGIEGVDRRHDLTSPSSLPEDRKLLPTSGGAAIYRRFLVEELKPWVAARWRTEGRTALMGESLAGLFVAETLLKAPASFDDYIAVSPSLWWNGGALSREAAADLRAGAFSGRRVWIAFDEPAPPAAQAARERAWQAQLEAAFAEVRPAGLAWKATRPGEDHGGIYHPAALRAFRDLYGASGALTAP
jgi:hypothetical protein